MTILTVGSCSFIVSTSGQMIPAAVGTACGVVMTGVKLIIQSEPVNVAIGTAVGTGTSTGAIAGAIVSKTAASAATGALLGGLSAAGVGSVLAGSLAATSGAIASSPFGLLAVGTNLNSHNEATYDCWKAVIHDTSDEASSGMTLKDLLQHPNIENVTVTTGIILPKIVLTNTWNEKFEIEYVVQESGKSYKLSCHASPLHM